MGIIRKTVSISTLGVVPFRSRKELLRRAERDRQAAEAELVRERTARTDADRRVEAAQKRVERAELLALREAKAATKAKAKAPKGNGKAKVTSSRRDRRRGAMEAVAGLLDAAQPVVQEQVEAAGRRARKAAKASQRAATKAQEEAGRRGRRARARLHEVERAMAPHVEAATERAHSLREEVVDLTATATAELKERADAVRERR